MRNYNVAVHARGEDIVFLRKIVPGGADRSYGIEVAKLAGLPDTVLKRAQNLRELESQPGSPTPRRRGRTRYPWRAWPRAPWRISSAGRR